MNHLLNDLLFFGLVLVGVNLFLILLSFFMYVKINSLQCRIDAHEKIFYLHNKAGMEAMKLLTLLKNAVFETGKAADKSDVKQG